MSVSGRETDHLGEGFSRSAGAPADTRAQCCVPDELVRWHSGGCRGGLATEKCDTCRVPSAGMGERIAVYRRRRGLSQAALVGRSESWLSQVERGIRSVDRLSVLLDMARILHVDVESLIGRPWQVAPNGGAVAQGLDAVRQVMTRYDHLLGVDASTMPALPELNAQIATLHQDYQAAGYEVVIRQLPELITLIDAIPRMAVAQERRESLCAYVSAYVGAAKLLTKLGVIDLAVVAADRAATIAVEADSLSARGMAAVDPTRLMDGLRSRRAQVYLDLAWAQAQRKRDGEMTLHLLETERWAPGAIRYNAMVRDLVREMLARARRPNSVLHDLSVRAGVLD